MAKSKKTDNRTDPINKQPKAETAQPAPAPARAANPYTYQVIKVALENYRQKYARKAEK